MYICECGAAFKFAKNLNAHRQICIEWAPYCPCGATFDHRSTMRAHLAKCEVAAGAIADDLRRVAREVGNVPTMDEYKERRSLPLSILTVTLKIYDSWDNLTASTLGRRRSSVRYYWEYDDHYPELVGKVIGYWERGRVYEINHTVQA